MSASEIDHRAEALRKLAQAQGMSHMAVDRANLVAEAQVHAILAGPPVRTVEIVADETAQRELHELRAAVREALDTSVPTERNSIAFFPSLVARLRELVGGAP